MTAIVLVAAVAVAAAVFHWSGRFGDRDRNSGTSLRRSPRSHTTAKGQAKKGYDTREEAVARAGDGLSAYKCDSCGKWHLGH
ncbi:MAG: hypothetical protein WA359_08035 [Acidimicrobiales bacterium]